MKYILGALVLISVVGCSSQKEKKAKSLPKTLEEAVASSYRSEEFRGRDKYRHPEETLNFFGVNENMTVLEIWPSGGWYTQILAPYLSEKGKYIIADPTLEVSNYTKKRFEWMKAHPEIAKKVMITQFAPPQKVSSLPDNSVDIILTFRNVHNWEGDRAKIAAFKSFYKALKPGGILGVVDHRANPNKKLDPRSGYIKERDVVRFARAAGFQLAGSSEVNANPKDTKDYTDGVWTLPPTLKRGDKDKEKYLEIGESDRFTLKFRK